MDSPALLSFPWVNEGRAFPLDAGMVTSEDTRQGLLAKIRSFDEAMRGFTKDAPEDVRLQAMRMAREVASISQFQAMLLSVARRQDTRLRDRKDEDVLALMTQEQFARFVDAVAPRARGGGGGSPPAPLAQPPSSDASPGT